MNEKEVYTDVSEAEHPSLNTKIHAVAQLVSLMKKSKTCSYFNGKATDGKRMTCIMVLSRSRPLLVLSCSSMVTWRQLWFHAHSSLAFTSVNITMCI